MCYKTRWNYEIIRGKGTWNKRVSDFNDYKTAAEAGTYFPFDDATLDDAVKADPHVFSALHMLCLARAFVSVILSG
jgi:hypothetical protein